MSDTQGISIERSLDASTLQALESRWDALRGRAAPTVSDALRAIEAEIEAHRARLFVENATLQADGADGAHAAEASERIESNQLAIKRCTVALAELREALSPR
jgi:hypothetical protein